MLLAKMLIAFASLVSVNAAPPISGDLKSLKEVHSARVVTESDTPKQTIIHLKDWHYVSKADYIIDKGINGADGLPATYDKFLESVSKVQTQQEAVLRMLIAKHGVKSVYKEGWCVKEKFFVDTAKVAEAMAKAAWLKQVRNKPDLEDTRLNLGPAGKLLEEGTLIEFRACESVTLLDDCNPFDENGKPRDVSEKTLEAREQFIVDQIVKGREKLSVVILGGAHDLSDNVPKDVRLIEVTVKAYEEVAK